MKPTRLWAILILLSLVIAACGGNTATGAPAGQASAAQTPAAAGAPDLATLPASVEPATVEALRSNPDVVLLDVREPDEYAAGHIPGITLIPSGQVADRLAEIPKDKTVIVTCRSGNRSQQVTDYLRQQGYTRVHNMLGGIISWEAAGYPVEK